MKSYTIGDRISQPQYGPGTITLANEYHLVIDFDDHGTRTFRTPMVQLAQCNIPAPVRVKRARRSPARAVAKA